VEMGNGMMPTRGSKIFGYSLLIIFGGFAALFGVVLAGMTIPCVTSDDQKAELRKLIIKANAPSAPEDVIKLYGGTVNSDEQFSILWRVMKGEKEMIVPCQANYDVDMLKLTGPLIALFAGKTVKQVVTYELTRSPDGKHKVRLISSLAR
jgi:hypothetical protein